MISAAPITLISSADSKVLDDYKKWVKDDSGVMT